MKKQLVVYGVGGLLVGALLSGILVWSVKENSANQESGAHNGSGSMTMQEMSDMLKNKTGDDFDKAFISNMIEHHQSAIDMANLAKTNAKHDEIKSMADAIISTQSKEIVMMQSWQTQWGYKDTASSHDMNTMDH